jgi:hypothetical protein
VPAKSGRKPRLRTAEFGSGILEPDPGLEPRINLLDLSDDEKISLLGPIEPALFEADDVPLCSTLPTIDGAGLSRDELFRINGGRNRARAAYATDCPDASPGELDRVAAAAARDELRRLLQDRPAAVASCCPATEPVPCLACSTIEAAAAAPESTVDVEGDPGEAEADATGWPAWTDADVWMLGPDPAEDPQVEAEAGGLLTLPELVEAEAARYRRMGTKLGDLLAHAMEGLAGTARLVHAFTPGDLEARLEVLEQDRPAPGLIRRDLARRLMATSLVGHDA